MCKEIFCAPGGKDLDCASVAFVAVMRMTCMKL